MVLKNIGRFVAALLILSAVLLGILVPGGPIETRSFSHITPLILGAFNTFLTTLGICSIAIAYFMANGKRWTFEVSTACGLSYLLVYALDLGKIFPVSPDAMPTALFVVEVVGILISLPLIYLSLKAIQMRMRHGDSQETGEAITKTFAWLLAVMIVAGIGIIVFATLSAMRK